MENTSQQYQSIIQGCRALFLKKAQDYGTAWTILRMPSITDQIMIKAQRIRSIQETQENRVGESEESEFIGIVNYCLIAMMLIAIQEGSLAKEDIEGSGEALARAYDAKAKATFDLMLKKNHDYGEAWREMRISSITDMILMKILRLKQIEDNAGKTLVSEGAEANYMDMLNYAVFCLIKIEEEKVAEG